MLSLKVKRGTRSQLDAAASAGKLASGEPYLITDEARLAVGISGTEYAAMARLEETENITNIAGYEMDVNNPQPNDVLTFNGSVFTNRAQVELTDGGNF